MQLHLKVLWTVYDEGVFFPLILIYLKHCLSGFMKNRKSDAEEFVRGYISTLIELDPELLLDDSRRTEAHLMFCQSLDVLSEG